MINSVPLLLAQLEQGEANAQEIATLETLIQQRVNLGLIPTDLSSILRTYIKELKQEQGLQ